MAGFFCARFGASLQAEERGHATTDEFLTISWKAIRCLETRFLGAFSDCISRQARCDKCEKTSFLAHLEKNKCSSAWIIQSIKESTVLARADRATIHISRCGGLEELWCSRNSGSGVASHRHNQASLLALTVELNDDCIRYGFGIDEAHHAIVSHGFQPASYDPFTRRLQAIDGRNRASANTIYLRGLETAQDRVSNAPPFVVNGRRI